MVTDSHLFGYLRYNTSSSPPSKSLYLLIFQDLCEFTFLRSTCVSFCLTIYMSLHPSDTCPIQLSNFLYFCFYSCISQRSSTNVRLSIHSDTQNYLNYLTVHLICQSVCWSIRLLVHVPVLLSNHPYLHICLCPPICRLACLFIRPSLAYSFPPCPPSLPLFVPVCFDVCMLLVCLNMKQITYNPVINLHQTIFVPLLVSCT